MHRLQYYFRSDMVDRMSALKNFDDTIDRMELDGTSNISLKMYNWIKDDGTSDIRYKRPRSSNIDADYLLEFEETGTSAPKPYVDFFIKRSDTSDKNPNVSIFKSEETFSDDTTKFKFEHPKRKSRALEDDIIVLSVTRTLVENVKEVSDTKTTDAVTLRNCREKAEETRRRIEENIKKSEEQKKALNSSPHANDSNRANTLFDDIKNKRKKGGTRYEKAISKLSKESDYTLKELKKSLKLSASSRKVDRIEMINNEIKVIDNILKERETKGSPVIMASQIFNKHNELKNINSDGTAVLDIFSSLKQSLHETGQQIKEYAEKAGRFLKEKVNSFISKFVKSHDKTAEISELSEKQKISDFSASEKEMTQDEPKHENDDKDIYYIDEMVMLYDFSEIRKEQYAELIENKKIPDILHFKLHMKWQEQSVQPVQSIQQEQPVQEHKRNDYDLDK